LELRQITRQIIGLVEEVSGLPVKVTENPRLGAPAMARMARGNMATHWVIYKPVPNEPPDYLICYHCGFILRKFALPPQQRFDLVPTSAARDAVHEAMVAPDGVARQFTLEESQLDALHRQFLRGLLARLSLVPLGMRVAAWLRSAYPDIRKAQRAQVLRELAEAKEALSPRVRAITPAKVYNASQCINAAYAAFWAEIYGNAELVAPYRPQYERRANDLLAIWRELPDDPAHDVALVDRWAGALGLADWCAWKPYDSPA